MFLPWSELTPKQVAEADQEFAEGLDQLAILVRSIMKHKDEEPNCKNSSCVGKDAAVILDRSTQRSRDVMFILASNALAEVARQIKSRLLKQEQ